MRELEKLREFVRSGVSAIDEVNTPQEMDFATHTDHKAVELFNTLVDTMDLLIQAPSVDEISDEYLPQLPYNSMSGVDLSLGLIQFTTHLLQSAIAEGLHDRASKYVHVMQQAFGIYNTIEFEDHDEMMNEETRTKLQKLIASFVLLLGYNSI